MDKIKGARYLLASKSGFVPYVILLPEGKMNKLITNIIICYLIVSIDFIGGFRTDFNIINWNTEKVIKFVVILIVVSVVDFFINKNRKK